MTRNRRSAFTLVELLAVGVILTVLAAVAISRTGDRGLAKLRRGEEAVLRTDAWARRQSETTGRSAELRFDVSADRLYVVTDGVKDEPRFMQDMPRGVSIERVISPREDRTRGELAARVGRGGEPYAIKLVGAQAAWIVFTGQTGQATRYHADEQPLQGRAIDDRQIEAYFRELRRATGVDAR